MLTNFNKLIIPIYSPISAKGGKRHYKTRRRKRLYKNKRVNKCRTRRKYY